MFSSSKKPYTAVTVQVERLTSPEYEENDYGGIVDLVEVIRIQDTGPSEAARALRKKLKYGNSHRQLRALTILDGLIQNAGGRFQRTFADEPLLERLRILASDDMSDKEVRDRCAELYRQWAISYKNTPGLVNIASLYKQLPSRHKPKPSQSKVIRETEEAARRDNPFAEPEPEPPRTPSPTASRRQSHAPAPISPTDSSVNRPRAASSGSIFGLSSSKKDKKQKYRSFNLEKEKPQMMQTIASSNIASTNLLNSLKHINRETQRVSQNRAATERFETCKQLRRQILRYIQLVESDQWIGSLLSANDELVKALMAYEIMDKSIDDDSDSETETAVEAIMNGGQADGARSRKNSRVTEQMGGLSLLEQAPAKPPRPGESALRKTSLSAPPPPVLQQKHEDDIGEEVDENDPFGDQNAI